jgi:hypothetical protein
MTTPAPAGSISGAVLDSQTGSPVANLRIRISQSISATTDAEGRYTLRNVPPGRHSLYAGVPVGSAPTFGLRVTTLRAGQDLSSIDLRVQLKGSISGKVVDENKEPVQSSKLFSLEGSMLSALCGTMAGPWP